MSKAEDIDAYLTAILALCDKDNTCEGSAIKVLLIKLSELLDKEEADE